MERRETWVQRQRLWENPVPQTFDMAHLCRLHYRLFSEIYSWAGEYRTVNIAKGTSRFLSPTHFPTAARLIEETIAQSTILDATTSDAEFVSQVSKLLADINYIHPFREGNGRAQRVFIDDIATHTGRVITWRNVPIHDYMHASIETFKTGDGQAFEPLFSQMLKPAIDGLSQLDSRVYDVTPVETTPLSSPHTRDDIDRLINSQASSMRNNSPAAVRKERTTREDNNPRHSQ